MSSKQKRALNFQSWDEVRRELAALLQGYEQNGKWNLSQIALHLNDWLTYPMDGFPPPPFPLSLVMTVIRYTVGKSTLKQILKSGFTDGTPTMPATVHDAHEQSDHDAVRQLLETIHRFQAFDGEVQPSALFGKLDYPTVEKLQLIHFAHHLNWLHPAS
ncbi:DUF1569 domain-containing protein [Planctomicrobium sp. SH668]|uniref:DUF1569 domain-containing protein n=1 Tax=Planctomicrobium sp. SH668 TaxID=3448126 RepID=UPI003F5CAE89